MDILLKKSLVHETITFILQKKKITNARCSIFNTRHIFYFYGTNNRRIYPPLKSWHIKNHCIYVWLRQKEKRQAFSCQIHSFDLMIGFLKKAHVK